MALKMTEEKPGTSLAVQEQRVNEIDKILKGCQLDAVQGAGLGESLALARNVQQLRNLITPDMIGDVMALMNTSLGFRTDRDPNRPTGEKPPVPYGPEVVKDVLIEAMIRGARPVGNEFNIISAQFYPTKNFLRRRLRELPGLTDLDRKIGVPQAQKDKDGNVSGAIVPCSATWRFDGQAGKIECEIPVKANRGMGSDAILGKAERKLDARILSKITGTEWTEADVEDVDDLRRVNPPAQTIEVKETGVAGIKAKLGNGEKKAEAPVDPPPIVPSDPPQRVATAPSEDGNLFG